MFTGVLVVVTVVKQDGRDIRVDPSEVITCVMTGLQGLLLKVGMATGDGLRSLRFFFRADIFDSVDELQAGKCQSITPN